MNDRQAIALQAINELKYEAMDSAYERYDLGPKVLGALLAIGGGLLMQAWLPGMGPWLARFAGIAIASGGVVVSAKEGALIEQGDSATIYRYVDEQRRNKLLVPYVEQLKGEAKKMSPQAKGASKQTKAAQNQSQQSTSPSTQARQSTETSVDIPNPQTMGTATSKEKTDGGTESIGSEPDVDVDPVIDFSFQGDLISTLAGQIHLLISATTGSGKSTILNALSVHALNRGDYLQILDPKHEQWGELQPYVRHPESAVDVVRAIKEMSEDYDQRKEAAKANERIVQHSWHVFDEWFLVKGLLGTLKDDQLKALEIRLIKVIAAGRSLGIHLVIVNQSHYLGDLSLSSGKNSFSTGLRSNIATLGLGAEWTLDGNGERAAAKYDSVELMLGDKALIPNQDYRQQGRQWFSRMRRGKANRIFMLSAGSLAIAPTPDLSNPVQLNLGQDSPQPAQPLPDLSKTTADDIPWHIVGPRLLEADGDGLKTNMSALLNHTLNGPVWQAYRDSLSKWLLAQPEQVSQAFTDKYPAVYPAAFKRVRNE